MFQNYDEARQFVVDNDVKMVDLKFCDLWGRWHHLTVPADQFTAELMEVGVGFDASSVGLKPVKAGDMVLVPDLSTGFVDPFWQVSTLSFICSAAKPILAFLSPVIRATPPAAPRSICASWASPTQAAGARVRVLYL